VIRTAVGGETAGQIFEGIRRFDILDRFASKFRDTPEAIGQILVQSPDGTNISLFELASIEEVVGPRQITRENNQRFISLWFNATFLVGTFVLLSWKGNKQFIP